uniref:Broad substrate specificity ATP-binding cassette transporter ABCG2 n=1 Tax=Macrostomum lignano TaxID=282301 RepID=A0A1I8HH76_9PLAT
MDATPPSGRSSVGYRSLTSAGPGDSGECQSPTAAAVSNRALMSSSRTVKYGSLESANRVSFSKEEDAVDIGVAGDSSALANRASLTSVGQYLRDQLPKPAARRTDNRPLLSESQASLGAASRVLLGERGGADDGPNSVGGGGNGANRDVLGDHVIGDGGCYSRDLAASTGDLAGGAYYRRSSCSGGSAYSGRSRAGSARGSVISFRDVGYEVSVKRGLMRPGLNAIMGPTGCGKTSLLDVLACRKDPRCVTGRVLIDGQSPPDNFKRVSGYVVQDDIVMGTLTVRENLYFSASVRLPGNWTREERMQKVEAVIAELGLAKVADSKIGTELIRGVSGGERKRTNIGMELITDPSVLFLDEPTTGLDAFTAGSVIRTMRSLANRGRTVVFSIHQPKYSIYRLFSYLTLLVNGEVIYHGRAGSAPLKYFKDLGYICDTHNSPPDFFMDMVHGELPAGAAGGQALDQADPLDDEDVEPAVEPDPDAQKDQSNAIAQHLVNEWRRSQLARSIERSVEEICQGAAQINNGGGSGSGSVRTRQLSRRAYPTGFGNQLLHVSWRTWLNLFRNPQSSVIQLIVYLFFGLSIGTVFFGLDTSLESGIQNRQGLFFFLTLQMVFVNLSAVEVFIKERAVFIHENSSGFYSVLVYFLAKILCDMLPIKTLPVLLFMPIIYFMAQLRLEAGAFLFYQLNLVLATCAACGVAFFVSASVSVFGIANILISIMYVFMMVFGGFLINIASVGWLSWCRYLSVFYYAYAGLSVNEFSGMRFCPTRPEPNVTRTCKDGSTVLNDQQIPHSTPWNLWSNELGMFCIMLVFLLLCYVQLCRINKYK